MVIFFAMVPAIALMIYIYSKDKIEKEPARLLVRCFIFGGLAILPAAIAEGSGEWFLGLFFTENSIVYTILENFFVVALVEEGLKLIALMILVDKSKEFDCMFDGIVYAVFISLGFAAFENIMYVMDGGIATAIRRMFTAVPGHMCFAVYMGYYYSRYKLGQFKRNADTIVKYGFLTLGVSVLLHGLYDCILSFISLSESDLVVFLLYFFWFSYVLAMYIVTFLVVNVASANDRFIDQR